MHNLLMLLLLAAASGVYAAEPQPIFDAHVHYSQEAGDRMPPKEAVALLRTAGVRRALVSSFNDDGNQMQYAEAIFGNMLKK